MFSLGGFIRGLLMTSITLTFLMMGGVMAALPLLQNADTKFGGDSVDGAAQAFKQLISGETMGMISGDLAATDQLYDVMAQLEGVDTLSDMSDSADVVDALEDAGIGARTAHADGREMLVEAKGIIGSTRGMIEASSKVMPFMNGRDARTGRTTLETLDRLEARIDRDLLG